MAEREVGCRVQAERRSAMATRGSASDKSWTNGIVNTFFCYSNNPAFLRKEARQDPEIRNAHCHSWE